jgi:hypothetical protein
MFCLETKQKFLQCQKEKSAKPNAYFKAEKSVGYGGGAMKGQMV